MRRYRLIRLRFRRSLRKRSRQMQDISTQAEKGLEKHFFKRFNSIVESRRFVASWVLLVVICILAVVLQITSLSGYYQTLQPVPGGIYNEGILGTFTTANPLFASSDVDTTVSHLVFSGLLTYNQNNQLVGDLASTYTVDSHGLVYTVHLKKGLKWQDGEPLTSADVLFTYKVIQNPDTQSPLSSSWRGVNISAPNKSTIVFTLPDPLASFPTDLTNGIVPEHILNNVPVTDLRSSDFNTVQPIGSGPFSWQAIQVIGGDLSTAQEQIALKPFDDYAGGKPKLQEFVIHAYASKEMLVADINNGQLTGAVGLDSVPQRLPKSWQVHSLPLTAATMVFFKTTSGLLSDTKVRQALVQSVDTKHIVASLGYTTNRVLEPILAGQTGYNQSFAQAAYNINNATSLLDSAGWAPGKDHLRYKDGNPLGFTLTAPDTSEYRSVANQLKDYWNKIGVNVSLNFESSSDFQNTLTSHNYDAVLYGISIGVDPDVFVYWHSSQADPRSANRLNLSEYKNSSADVSLEAGRTRLDPTLRAIKYKPFLKAWQSDAPALGLYQPRVLYLTNGNVFHLGYREVNGTVDRLRNVQNWEIREVKVTN